MTKHILNVNHLKSWLNQEKLIAFKHYGFWQCMDTLRDKVILENKLKKLNKSILIAGGTGFIGFHLAKKCLHLKWSVTSLSTSQPKKT